MKSPGRGDETRPLIDELIKGQTTIPGPWKGEERRTFDPAALGMEELQSPTLSEILKAFSAREGKGGLVELDKAAAAGGPKPVMHNVLVQMGIPEVDRYKLYRAESCGARPFQIVTVSHEAWDFYSLVYRCDGFCAVIREKGDGKKSRVSRPVPVNKSLCEGLWGGVVPVDTKSSI